MTKVKTIVATLYVSCVVAGLIWSPLPVSAFTASLSTIDGGLHAENDWDPVFLRWDITQLQPKTWTYEFDL